MPSINLCEQSGRVTLTDPFTLPQSAAYLWNKNMMIHMNCRGYATSQFMQPEPTKYAKQPFLEAVTFMQPEQPYFSHHPGRFFYIKDNNTGKLFSAPYEPSREPLDVFNFTADKSEISWLVEALEVRVELSLSLPTEDIAELWTCEVTNLSEQVKDLSIYAYFPFGYMSWMNQSGYYSEELNAMIGKCITPYQKLEFYEKNKHLKDLTYLLCNEKPDAWEARQSTFEGEGGLAYPDGIKSNALSCNDALYEVPTAAMQFNRSLQGNTKTTLNFAFGPALNEAEITRIKTLFIDNADKLAEERDAYNKQVCKHLDILEVSTPDKAFDHFVNHWLARQVFYHGDVNRLSTDPQTRNYIQDNMGMSYLKPDITKGAFITALSQQKPDGAMPDGVVLIEGGELKYINQIPHTDHCVWLPICLQAYLDETNDYAFLEQRLPFASGEEQSSVLDHITRAMRWLLTNRDERGLAYIAQGDWCDPMNMVGPKGIGVSGWLTMAMAYAMQCWATICRNHGKNSLAEEFEQHVSEVCSNANKHLWDGQWYARGITDDNVKFGISEDDEGRIFLNPQSWAMLAGAADEAQQSALIQAIENQLDTPYGSAMLAPAYTAMRDDVGRVTQKFPGSAENGSVYNHAAAFYVYALYKEGLGDKAYSVMRKMIPGPSEDDYTQRGQLPVFIPNYYRGAYKQHPRTAGRSSQLFNTGTVHWVLRSLIDGLLGLRGSTKGLTINPQLPSEWQEINVKRKFRGAEFNVTITRANVENVSVVVDGVAQSSNVISEFTAGNSYDVQVSIP